MDRYEEKRAEMLETFSALDRDEFGEILPEYTDALHQRIIQELEREDWLEENS
jgi:hypothetical protein